MKQPFSLLCLLLAGCASNPAEPGLWDYVKVFGELAGEAVVAVASGVAENADEIAGATNAYSSARNSGATKGDAYQAAAQSLSSPAATPYGAASGSARAGACNRSASQMSVGEFLMCAADDCRQRGGTRASGRNNACYGCVINGLTMWTRCHPSGGGVSSAT